MSLCPRDGITSRRAGVDIVGDVSHRQLTNGGSVTISLSRMSFDFFKQAVEHIANAAKDPPALTALLILLIVGFGGGFLLESVIYAGTQSALEKSLAGEQSHSAELQRVYEQRLTGIQQDYEQRLKGKDDLLDEYRRRLQIITPKGGELAQLTNSELKARTIQFVSELRKWERKYDEERRAQSDQEFYEETKAGDNREELFRRHIEKDERRFSEHMANYNTNFKATAILLRDEISSRLPPAASRNQETQGFLLIFANPVTSFSIDLIATNLEMLAKSLD